MTVRVSRRFLLGGIGAFALAGPAHAGAPATSLRPQLRGGEPRARAAAEGIEALIARSGLSGEVACTVADARTGLRLESVHGQTGLPPASVAKSLTALYALDRLGAGHRFATRILTDGTVNRGILSGDLILAGGGDPTLDTNGLADLAAQIKSAGIREVRGRFVVYEGALPYVRSIDPDQPEQVGYSPAVTGIALNFNRVHFEWKRASSGYSIAMDARSNRYRPAVAMARMQVVNRRMPVYTYDSRDGADQWTVAAAALGNGGARWLPVRRPALYAGDVFRTLARSNGIVLPAPDVSRLLPPDARPVADLASAPLRDLLADMLKYSTNLTAEMIGMSASAAGGRAPESLAASALDMSRWAASRYGMSGTRLVDHSGLGDASRMTPDDLVAALTAVYKDGTLQPLFKPFLMRDDRGRPLNNHPIEVDAKTGTLNFVSGLGGYLTAADGTELAFAIFTADSGQRDRTRNAAQEIPDGARAWNRKSKRLQQKLIERWGALYGGS